MCLIIFSYQPGSSCPLIVAANRDEFFARPTAQASIWDHGQSSEQVLAGQDLQAGGTWLGVTRSQRFAAVTNIRDPSQTAQKPRSRGELTRCYLQGTQTAKQYAMTLADSFDQYAPYNLLLADQKSFFYVNNQQETISAVAPGVYGLSNGTLDSPWPKINKGKAALEGLLQAEGEIRSDDLIAMMHDSEPASDIELPDTGVPLELERVLSSAFIINTQRHYGTLCSTAVIVERTGSIRFCEQNYDETGARIQSHFFQLQTMSV